MADTQYLVDHIDEIIEAAKKVKSGKGRYQTTLSKEQKARDDVKALNLEAHTITTALVNDADTSELRDLATVQRELLRAHNKVDAAIDKSHEDTEAMDEACKALVRLMRGVEADAAVEQEDSEQVALVVNEVEDSEQDYAQQAVNA